ncbi:hypothetical protein, partial [Escherichia coli]|uniref:hypothetical protein n=1 Tax=Escherichia coli TaxID=562 RepID=UPI001BAE6FF8
GVGVVFFFDSVCNVCTLVCRVVFFQETTTALNLSTIINEISVNRRKPEKGCENIAREMTD